MTGVQWSYPSNIIPPNYSARHHPLLNLLNMNTNPFTTTRLSSSLSICLGLLHNRTLLFNSSINCNDAAAEQNQITNSTMETQLILLHIQLVYRSIGLLWTCYAYVTSAWDVLWLTVDNVDMRDDHQSNHIIGDIQYWSHIYHCYRPLIHITLSTTTKYNRDY